MKFRIALAGLLVLGMPLLPRVAFAQASGYAVNRFEPSESGSDWYANESLDLRGALRPAASAVIDWAYAPLVLHDPGNIGGAKRADVITDQIFMHAGAALVVADRFRFATSLPVALYQHGDDLTGIATAARAPDKPSVGDLRLTADARIFGTYRGPLTAATSLQVHLPTGNRALFTGDGTVRVTPRIRLAGEAHGFVYAAQLGYAFRPNNQTFEGRMLGSEVLFSVAVGVTVNKRFVLGPELYGSTVVTGGDRAFRTRATPLELLLGGHITLWRHWRTGAGIGPALTRADGSPTMRVVVSLAYAPDVAPPRTE